MAQLIQRALSTVAVVFGIATIVSGSRVLLGGDPGYVVFRPLLIFNSAMGLAYVASGIVAWNDARRGWRSALAVFILNGIVLAIVGYLHLSEGIVAVESVLAMIFRSSVWGGLTFGWYWIDRRQRTIRGA